jgi:hypothetical protein
VFIQIFFQPVGVVLYANLMSLERGDSQLSNDTKFVENGSKNDGQNRFSVNISLNINDIEPKHRSMLNILATHKKLLLGSFGVKKTARLPELDNIAKKVEKSIHCGLDN